MLALLCGALVDAALDVVDAVAIVARGGDDEAHLEERLAVDAVDVVARRPADTSSGIPC